MDHPAHEDQATELREYLAVLKARKWTIIGIAALVIASALFFSARQTPIYRAESRLLVRPLPGASSDAAPEYINLDTQSQLVASTPVAIRVKNELDLRTSTQSILDGLEVTPAAATGDVLVVAYSSTDPALARDAANSFSDEFINYRGDQAQRGVEAAQSTIEQRRESVSQKLTALGIEIEEARAAVDTQLVADLESRRSILLAQLGVLEQQLDDVQPDSSLALVGGEVIEPAALPASPASPDHMKNGLLAAFLGLALGVGIAFLRERLDDRFRGRTDVERALQAPVLATIPRYRDGSSDTNPHAITVTEPRGPAAESYRTLRTSLQFIASQRSIRSILVNSAGEAEGKTATAANLATALAQAGRRCVLVSGDLRRPMVERYYDASIGSHGVSTWLSYQDDDLKALVRDTDIENLHVLPSGPIPPNPAELLNSPRFNELVRTLEERADMVIFDSPPTLSVSDAPIMAAHVGGVILVIDSENTGRSTAVHAKEALERVGGYIVGCVLNAFDPTSAPYGYGKGYGYGYYGETATPKVGSMAAGPPPPPASPRGQSERAPLPTRGMRGDTDF